MKNLKKGLIFFIIFLIFITVFPTGSFAYVSVHGYFKSNGTYVAPYVRSNPNGLKYDNYGYKPSQGLYNPTYGTRGTEWDTPTSITDPNYYEGKALYESGSSGLGSINNPSTLLSPQKPTVSAPLNAYVSGSTWYCNTGYKTTYNSSYQKIGCEKVVAPLNAYVSGSDWYCNTGYKTIYNSSYQKVSCEKVIAPTNAYISGSDWYCNSGYKTVYNSSYQKVSCQLVIAPPNAYISGSDWYCNTGYKTIYDSSFKKASCQKVIAPANAYVSGNDWYCNTGYKTTYNSLYQKVGCELK